MYAQTVLGPIWLVISAVLSSSVMTLVFGTIAGISTDGIPQFLFYLSGNILWMNFSGCVTGCADSLLSHAGLMGKVYFPRLCAPISVVLSRQFQFLVQTCIFFLVYGVLLRQGGGWGPTWWVLATPLLVVQLLALATGTGLILAAATVRYRDIRVLVTFGLQIWMYATPVVYPASQIQAQWRWLYLLNPVAPVVECFRGAFGPQWSGEIHPAQAAGPHHGSHPGNDIYQRKNLQYAGGGDGLSPGTHRPGEYLSQWCDSGNEAPGDSGKTTGNCGFFPV